MSETEDLGQLITTLTAEADRFEAERDALQQRIDWVLTLCRFAIADSKNYTDPKVPFVDAGTVLAVLTDTPAPHVSHSAVQR